MNETVLPSILARMDQQEEQVRDEHGVRWIRCKDCGKVAPDDAFISFGGIGCKNLGECRECYMKKIGRCSDGGSGA